MIALLTLFSCKEENSKSDSQHKFTNALIDETSPYLLQHAHNPVEWRSWNPEALEEAKKDDKLVLVSIGYSSCHWCHVMEEETFEDEAVAKVMNESFINIKVDREERPDVDQFSKANRWKYGLAFEYNHPAKRKTTLWRHLSFKRPMGGSFIPNK